MLNKVLRGFLVSLVVLVMTLAVLSVGVMVGWNLLAEGFALPAISFTAALGVSILLAVVRVIFWKSKSELKLIQPTVRFDEPTGITQEDVAQFLSERLKEMPDESMVKG